MSDRFDSPVKLGTPANDRENLQGGSDLDTERNHDGEADSPRTADKRSGSPYPTTPPDPTAEDPFVAGTLNDTEGDDIEPGSGDLANPEPIGEGPSYEREQGPTGGLHGGSSDEANSRSEADSQEH